MAAHLHRRPPRPLSGLLRCGTCGAGMTSLGKAGKSARVQCSAHRESGICDNGRKVDRDAIERLVLNGLTSTLGRPDSLKVYVTAYNRARQRLAANANRERTRLERLIGENRRATDRTMHALMYGDDDPATFREPIRRLERDRVALEAALAALDEKPKPVALHPGAIAGFERDLTELQAVLANNDDSRRDNAIAAVRKIVDRVIVHAPPNTRGFSIEIKGNLAALLGDDRSLFTARSEEGGLLVAGEGFEPPTRGL
ncbi:MAG: zinc ribbon domain-containing protein [Pseudorhodoplanes sp.]